MCQGAGCGVSPWMIESAQNAQFGNSFENLGQQRRVDVLCTRGDRRLYEIKPDVVRIRRKCYLHLWSEEHGQLRKNAVSVYNATASLVVVKVIGQDCQDGKLLLNPAFVT